MAHIFHGLQEEIKFNLRFLGRLPEARLPRVPLERRGLSPASSSRTKHKRSALLGGAALVHGFWLAVKVLLDSKTPGTEPLLLTKASHVFCHTCSGYIDKERSTEQYGDQDCEVSD